MPKTVLQLDQIPEITNAKLAAEVTDSLDLADTAVQPGDLAVLSSDGESLARCSEGTPATLTASASISVGRAPSIQQVTVTEATTFTFTLEVGDTVTLGVSGDFTLSWAGASAETIKWTNSSDEGGTAPDPSGTGQLWVQFSKIGASMIHASFLYYVV
jgi:hypothetical protein